MSFPSITTIGIVVLTNLLILLKGHVFLLKPVETTLSINVNKCMIYHNKKYAYIMYWVAYIVYFFLKLFIDYSIPLFHCFIFLLNPIC